MIQNQKVIDDTRFGATKRIKKNEIPLKIKHITVGKTVIKHIKYTKIGGTIIFLD